MGRLKHIKSDLSVGERIHKRESLGNFQWFKKYKESNYSEVLSALNTLEDLMKQSPGFSYPDRSSGIEKLRYHLYQTLMNLCDSYFVDKERYVAYHRAKDKYLSGTQYHKWGFSYEYLVKKVISFLKDHEYIEHVTGVRFGNVRNVSRMRATQKLISLIKDHGVSHPMIKVPIPTKSSSCSDLFRPAVPKVIDQSFRNIPTRKSERSDAGIFVISQSLYLESRMNVIFALTLLSN